MLRRLVSFVHLYEISHLLTRSSWRALPRPISIAAPVGAEERINAEVWSSRKVLGLFAARDGYIDAGEELLLRAPGRRRRPPADPRHRHRRGADDPAARSRKRRLRCGRLPAGDGRARPLAAPRGAHRAGRRARPVGLRRRQLRRRLLQLQRHRRDRARGPCGRPPHGDAGARARRQLPVLDSQPRLLRRRACRRGIG